MFVSDTFGTQEKIRDHDYLIYTASIATPNRCQIFSKSEKYGGYG
jgi:hypothetical protein